MFEIHLILKQFSVRVSDANFVGIVSFDEEGDDLVLNACKGVEDDDELEF